MLCIIQHAQLKDCKQASKYSYTPCLKKLCKIVSVRTWSNFHQFW